MTTFRFDILKHLSTSIVVKEHRQRYQVEQYQRFMATLAAVELKSPNLSIDDFCRRYSSIIQFLSE